MFCKKNLSSFNVDWKSEGLPWRVHKSSHFEIHGKGGFHNIVPQSESSQDVPKHSEQHGVFTGKHGSYCTVFKPSWKTWLLLKFLTVMHSRLIIVLILCSRAAGAEDLPCVQWHEHDAKWQDTDVSGFYHAFQIPIYTWAAPDLALVQSTSLIACVQLSLSVNIVYFKFIHGVKIYKTTHKGDSLVSSIPNLT